MRYKDTLTTERLVLRPLTSADFAAAHSWGSDLANTRYMLWGPNSEEQTRDFLATARPGKDFAVVLRDSGQVIGSCGIYPDPAGDTGELGWILHKDHWKRGFGTELGSELLSYGFNDLRLRRVCAPCAAVNYGSYRVMERNGMRREAVRVKAFWDRVDKEWIDEAEYALLAEEYFTPKCPPGGQAGGAEGRYAVITTACADTEEAGKIATILLEGELAACVQFFPVSSRYVWQGETRADNETLLFIKCRRDKYAAIERAILANHSYELPEILLTPVAGGHQRYLGWIDKDDK
ncbi:MAG: divalent cation tolerance protein CutA [Peptococcaceae bacterium]|jgi:RimJ/RimL family protein N-acetyltransferase/uncharacterized protein involved in tolerance to divalent cations|nr:divalent cation tolerance protein CutA [Peptococcaceae bacterium]